MAHVYKKNLILKYYMQHSDKLKMRIEPTTENRTHKLHNSTDLINRNEPVESMILRKTRVPPPYHVRSIDYYPSFE